MLCMLLNSFKLLICRTLLTSWRQQDTGPKRVAIPFGKNTVSTFRPWIFFIQCRKLSEPQSIHFFCLLLHNHLWDLKMVCLFCQLSNQWIQIYQTVKMWVNQILHMYHYDCHVCTLAELFAVWHRRRLETDLQNEQDLDGQWYFDTIIKVIYHTPALYRPPSLAAFKDVTTHLGMIIPCFHAHHQVKKWFFRIKIVTAFNAMLIEASSRYSYASSYWVRHWLKSKAINHMLKLLFVKVSIVVTFLIRPALENNILTSSLHNSGFLCWWNIMKCIVNILAYEIVPNKCSKICKVDLEESHYNCFRNIVVFSFSLMNAYAKSDCMIVIQWIKALLPSR